MEIIESELPAAIPGGTGVDDERRKLRFSCSGSGRIEKDFELKHLNIAGLDREAE